MKVITYFLKRLASFIGRHKAPNREGKAVLDRLYKEMMLAKKIGVPEKFNPNISEEEYLKLKKYFGL